LEEIPQQPGEIRLGRYGRKNVTLEKEKELLSRLSAAFEKAATASANEASQP
jgi:hypothetical protein